MTCLLFLKQTTRPRPQHWHFTTHFQQWCSFGKYCPCLSVSLTSLVWLKQAPMKWLAVSTLCCPVICLTDTEGVCLRWRACSWASVTTTYTTPMLYDTHSHMKPQVVVRRVFCTIGSLWQHQEVSWGTRMSLMSSAVITKALMKSVHMWPCCVKKVPLCLPDRLSYTGIGTATEYNQCHPLKIRTFVIGICDPWPLTTDSQSCCP